MKLEFNSVGELSEFLEWSRMLGAATVRVGDVSVTDPAASVLSAEVLRQTADAVEPVTPGMVEQLAELEEAQGNESAPTEQPEPTKRKRRTKAEMEAARAAEAKPADGFGMTSAQSEAAVVGHSKPETSTANPFEASNETSASTATEAILNAPNGQAATLAGIAAMQTQSPFEPAPEAQATAVALQAAQAAPVIVGDAATFLETRSLELLTAGEPIKTVEHMHKCRDFIAKHGQAKYLESFPLAGLTATIGTFKPEQCARHQAALEFLSANA